MGEPGWGYVVAAYSFAALVLILYELKLQSELWRRRDQESATEGQES